MAIEDSQVQLVVSRGHAILPCLCALLAGATRLTTLPLGWLLHNDEGKVSPEAVL
jgi:hypothetical protein